MYLYATPAVLCVRDVMVMVLTEVANRSPLEMTWLSLDQVKLVGAGLAANPKEKVKSLLPTQWWVSNTVEAIAIQEELSGRQV